jgi:hypothetical protein
MKKLIVFLIFFYNFKINLKKKQKKKKKKKKLKQIMKILKKMKKMNLHHHYYGKINKIKLKENYY